MHLKDRAEYEGRYDRATVDYFRAMAGTRVETQSAEQRDAARRAHALLTYIERGERWLEKRATVEGWMERDRIFDRIEARAPYGPVGCTTCGADMEPGVGTVECNYDEPLRSRMLYLYHCPNRHVPGKAVYTDGTEKVFEVARCVQCASPNVTDTREPNSETVVTTCQACGHTTRLELMLTPKVEMSDPDFEHDRATFCMSDEEGEEYRTSKAARERLMEMDAEAAERKKHQALYDAVAKIEKLTIFQLEAKVRSALEQLDFADVRFEKAETGRFVVLPFSFQETKSDRVAVDGETIARKTLQDTLAPTNWRLMSDGLRSKLGQFEGRLKGYDSEEDLLTLVHPRSSDQADAAA